MRKRWNHVRVVILLVLVLASSSFTLRVTASPEWDHSKPGDGLFVIDFDPSGHATAVHVVKSTGSAKFDATTIARLKRWTVKPGAFKHITVPVTYTSQTGH